jgi:sulfate permease, SulP family
MLSFRPRLFTSLRGYRAQDFSHDLAAGLTVGIVALPLAMAFAIASGLKPEAGIYTAIIGGFLISLLGGLRVQIGGPAGAFIVIVYGILERHGPANLLIATAMAGVLIFALGALRLGNLVRLVPVPIVIGFTNGIAVLIAFSQVRDAFGLQIDKLPADFFATLNALWHAAPTFNPTAAAICAACLLLLAAWPKGHMASGTRPLAVRVLAHAPGSVVALALATAAVAAFNLPVETIGSRFGGIPQGLPHFSVPGTTWEAAKVLVAPALTLALLGAIESLLCARVADKLTGERHDPNQELMAQGIANFVVPFFGGMPATGTIARTVTNIRSGARSPVAGILHAATLLLILLAAAPFAAGVPLAALAAVLLYVAWTMGEWRQFAHLGRYEMKYPVIMLSTFALTVVFDLTVAVQVGLLLSALFFIYRMSSISRIERVEAESSPEVEVYRLYGSLFFASVSMLEPLLDPERRLPKRLVLDMRWLITLDTSGLDALTALREQLARSGGRLVISGCGGQPEALMRRAGFLDQLETGALPSASGHPASSNPAP